MEREMEDKIIAYVGKGRETNWHEIEEKFEVCVELDLDEDYLYEAIFYCEICKNMFPYSEIGEDEHGDHICKGCIPEYEYPDELEEPEPEYHVVVADWEDMHNDYPYASPKQYGLEVFQGTYQECLDWYRAEAKDMWSPYSNFTVEERY